MVVKKYKLDCQTKTFKLIREIVGIAEDKVFVEMTMDLPYEKPDYMYEAGKMIGDKFDPQYVWKSINPNLFD